MLQLSFIGLATSKVLKSQTSTWEVQSPKNTQYSMNGVFYTETTATGDTPFLLVATKVLLNEPPKDGIIV